jgi:hypothetical protein
MRKGRYEKDMNVGEIDNETKRNGTSKSNTFLSLHPSSFKRRETKANLA